jgi:hypothetical protein
MCIRRWLRADFVHHSDKGSLVVFNDLADNTTSRFLK